MTFTHDLEERHQLPVYDFLGVAEYLWTKNITKSYKEANYVVICLSIEYNGGGGTKVDDLLDAESQKRFTAISSVS